MPGSHDDLLRFNNLLKRLTESRKIVYLLDYGFMIKGYDSEQPDARDGTDKEVRG